MQYEISAGVILFRQLPDSREYLLLHYPGGHFDFPKGHIEGEETEREAAIRELREETGIDQITWMEGFREKINYVYQRNGGPSSKDVIFFLARTAQKKVTISFEHKDSMWLPYKEALAKATYQKAKDLLQHAESFLKKQEKSV